MVCGLYEKDEVEVLNMNIMVVSGGFNVLGSWD